MKILRKFNSSVLLFSALVLFSCTEEFDTKSDELGSLNQELDVIVKEGVLAFKNEDSYETIMKSLSGLSNERLDEWEKNLDENFTSMRTAFIKMDESILPTTWDKYYDGGFFTIIQDRQGNTELVRSVDSDILATVLNEKGVFKIGKKYYLITYEQVYEFEDASLLNKIEGNDLGAFQNVTKYSVIRTLSSIGGENLARVGTCNDEYRNRRRFRAELWISNTPPVYSGAGARAKHQRYIFPAWWANSTNEITLDVDGTFTQTGPGPVPVSQYINFTDTQYNTANIQWVWYECFGVSCSFDASARVEVYGVNGSDTGGCVIP